MEVKILATGSTGNCYTVSDGQTCIMLDCGLPFNRIQKLTDYKLPDAVFVTHEHQDHAKAVKDFIKRGVDVYMTAGTAEALGIEPHHRLKILADCAKVGAFEVYGFSVHHDAKEPVNFELFHGENLLVYITDCGYMPFSFSKENAGAFTYHICPDDRAAPVQPCSFRDCPSITLVAMSTSGDKLAKAVTDGAIDVKQAVRIEENHLAVEQAAEWLKQQDLTKCEEIYLIHTSSRHAVKEEVKDFIRSQIPRYNGKIE